MSLPFKRPGTEHNVEKGNHEEETYNAVYLSVRCLFVGRIAGWLLFVEQLR